MVQKICFNLTFLIKIGTICLILSYFVSIGHILTYLVKFCLFQSYFAHIMSYLWYFFSWSISHQIDKVGQIVDAPPQPVTPIITHRGFQLNHHDAPTFSNSSRLFLRKFPFQSLDDRARYPHTAASITCSRHTVIAVQRWQMIISASRVTHYPPHHRPGTT